MTKSKQISTVWPIALAVASIPLLIGLFYVALANVAPLNTAPGVFLVPVVPAAVAIVALVLNRHNTKLHTATIVTSIISLIMASMLQLFFVGSAILWSAG